MSFPEQVLRESRLPSRMEKHAKKKKAVGSGEAGDEISNPVETRPTSGSKLLAPERIREMMARKQRLWDKRLAAARLKKKPVVPKVSVEGEILLVRMRRPVRKGKTSSLSTVYIT